MTPSVFSPEGLSGLLFLVFLAVTAAGALIAVGSGPLVRSVAGLALCFVGVAGLYWFLGSPFVALMQVLIYVGAVCVTIIFAVMLADTGQNAPRRRRPALVAATAAVAAAALLWALTALAIRTRWEKIPGEQGRAGLEGLGAAFLNTWGLSFELISVVLFLAIVGSLVLARQGRSRR